MIRSRQYNFSTVSTPPNKKTISDEIGGSFSCILEEKRKQKWRRRKLAPNPGQQASRPHFLGECASFALFWCTPPLLRKCTEKAQKKCVLPKMRIPLPRTPVFPALLRIFGDENFFGFDLFPVPYHFVKFVVFQLLKWLRKRNLPKKARKLKIK